MTEKHDYEYVFILEASKMSTNVPEEFVNMLQKSIEVSLECPKYVILPNSVRTKAIVRRDPVDQNIKYKYEWNSEELKQKGGSVEISNNEESEITIKNLPVGSYQVYLIVTESPKNKSKEQIRTCQATADFEVYPGSYKLVFMIKMLSYNRFLHF